MKNLMQIMRLSVNDLKTKYSATALGIVWAFIQPICTLLVFWFVFQVGLRTNPIDDVPYILWYIVAYIPWIYFSDILSYGVNCLIDYNYLVKKVKFNVNYLPLIRVLSALFIHLFFIGFIYIMYSCYHFKISLFSIQMIYYTLAITILGWGCIMFLSALTCFFKDIANIVNIILQIGFWATPILWNIEDTESTIKFIIQLNPVCYIVTGYRDSMIYNIPFWKRPHETIYFWVLTAIICILGTWTFNKMKVHFADEL